MAWKSSVLNPEIIKINDIARKKYFNIVYKPWFRSAIGPAAMLNFANIPASSVLS